jgi:hypothetical protein
MFKHSKYTNWYYAIINRAQSQQRSKQDDVRYDLHHIIPRSLNGNNDFENVVLLTLREHSMFGTSMYKLWIEKYGVEEAERRKELCCKKRSASLR